MRRLRKTLVSLLLFAALWTAGAAAQTVQVSVQDAKAPAGKDVNIDLQTGDLTGLNVYSFEFVLVYDPAVLTATAVVSNGTISASWGTPTVNLTQGRVAVAFAGIDPLQGSGSLIRIRFHVNEGAAVGTQSELALLSFQFNEGTPAAALQNGTFTVGEDTDPPRLTRGPEFRDRDYHRVRVYLETDEPSVVTLAYGETESYGLTAQDTHFSTSHSIWLENLRETTEYHLQVQLTDSLGNGPARSEDFRFRTRDVTVNLGRVVGDPGTQVQIPVTVPRLDGLGVTQVRLSVRFPTNLLALQGISLQNALLSQWSQPQVSISGNVFTLEAGGSQPLSGSGTLVMLTGTVPANAPLNQSGALEWQEVELNSGQIRLLSGNGSITVKDRMAPIITAGPSVSTLIGGTAVISWETNEPSTSVVQYGTGLPYTAELSDADLTQTHRLQLSGLQAGAEYHFRVGSSDASGNGPTWSSDRTFTVPAAEVSAAFADTALPGGETAEFSLQVSDLSGYGVTQFTALVAYDPALLHFEELVQAGSLTSGWSALQVNGEAGLLQITGSGPSALAGSGSLFGLKFTATNPAVLTETELSLVQLIFDGGWPRASLRSGKISLIPSGDTQPPVITSGPFVDKITSSSARIFWITDEPALGEVEFGPDLTYGSKVAETAAKIYHQVMLSGLAAGATFHFRVRNRDLQGNLSEFSPDAQFQTLPGNSVLVDMPAVQVAPGAVFDLPIRTANVSNLGVYSCDIELAFDSSLLSAVSVTSQNTLTSSWGDPVYTVQAGRLIIAAGGIAPLQGSGNLFVVRLRLADSAPAGSVVPVRFASFAFNEGTPAATVASGRVKVRDIRPPVLTGGPSAALVTSTSAWILWQTDEPADSRVSYGTASPDERALSDGRFRTVHALQLADLQPGTAYLYRIASRDTSGNLFESGQTFQFTTPAASAFRLEVGSARVERGETFSLPVSIAQVAGRAIFSLNFSLGFDPDRLEFLQASPASGLPPGWSLAADTSVAGTVTFQLAGDQPVLADRQILSVQLRAKGGVPYGTEILLSPSGLKVNGEAVAADYQPGRVQVVDRTPPAFVSGPAV
ncbi:MAG TPA: hypothetical protein ENK07_01630, partial [Bacteroidetes bacterium]|nr:hypothetical protein [Bacteroidota bacterium]